MNDTAKEPGFRDRPDMWFDEPLDLVDRTDLDYEIRLDMLQRWQARIAAGQATRGTAEEVEGAIFALQARSKLKTDTPEEQPTTTTYGGVERSDLRRYGLWRVVERLRGVLRR